LIGVIPKPDQLAVVEEFFELFKTPWELWRPGPAYDVVIATADEVPEVNAKVLLISGPSTKSVDACLGIAAGARRENAVVTALGYCVPIYGGLLTFSAASKGTQCVAAGSDIAGLQAGGTASTAIRIGYDLFDETRFLLSAGQPVEQAQIPALEIHIALLREWILQAGLALLEIPPIPAGHKFAVCLTHDIDFVGIRRHRFDHSMWGFVYRATVGGLRNFLRGRLSLACLVRSWLAVATLPLVYAGLVRDFWEPFEWYLRVEKGLPATYFLIPFKRRRGDKVPGQHASRRATAYDIGDLPHQTDRLRKHGCELGVHGIDAWHSVEQGREELQTIAKTTDPGPIGIRMHWLLRDAETASVLDRAGYAYDSTVGYNETVGYRAGTSQVFRPLGARAVLELPLHIQDGALFYPQRLDLSEPEAAQRCQTLIDQAGRFGGVLTVLWHDRSHGPERFWGGFYIKLVDTLRSADAWFGTAGQVVDWFRNRRDVRFGRAATMGGEGLSVGYEGTEIKPALRIRIHKPRRAHGKLNPANPADSEFVDISWNGKFSDELERQINSQLGVFSASLPTTCSPATSPDAALCSHS
jgi:hypothetical protein